jgi:hypothetical protein
VSQPTEADIQKFARRVDELRHGIIQADPMVLAHHTASLLHRRKNGEVEFHLEMWGRALQLVYPALNASWSKSGEALSLIDLTMLLYYFHNADGEPLYGRWISFTELPDGRFYNQAFQGYTGHSLARHFGNQGERFSAAASSLGGSPYPLGSAASVLQALPRVPLAVVYWQGDEDFPSSYQVLFDAAARHYLPTDAYAILGSVLTRRLINADKQG